MPPGGKLDIIDTAHSNQNGMRGAVLLKEQLGSRVSIYDIDLDEQFRLPRGRYGLVLLMGILYHLRESRFYVLQLSRRSRRYIVSTRVARLAGTGESTSRSSGRLPGRADRAQRRSDQLLGLHPGWPRAACQARRVEIDSTLNVGDTATSVRIRMTATSAC